MIPDFLRGYFWDTDFSKIDPRKNEKYIIERLLEMGDIESFLWLKKTFGIGKIREVLIKSRKLSVRSANFWAVVLGVDPKEVRCLTKQSSMIRESHWI